MKQNKKDVLVHIFFSKKILIYDKILIVSLLYTINNKEYDRKIRIMKKIKKKMNEIDKIVIAVCVLAISIGYALIVNVINANNIESKNNNIKPVEYIYTTNTRNTIYMNCLIDKDIPVYNNALDARKTFGNKRVYLRHKVKNKIKWMISDNENTFYFDKKKECVEVTNNSQFPELANSKCKEQITRKIEESYVGFVITSEMKNINTKMIKGNYYIKSGNSYNANVKKLKKIFGNSEDNSNCIEDDSSLSCSVENIKVTVFNNGSVIAEDGNSYCTIESNGSSYCNEENN